MLGSFGCFQMYMAMKAHFNQKTYDYFKYNGKVKITHSQFEQRNDKYFFQKLNKHEDPKGFLLANFVNNRSFWVGEINQNVHSQEVYLKWKGAIQSLSYNFQQQIRRLLETYTLEELIRIPEDGHPKILTAYLQNEISLECLVIFVDCSNSYNYWNKGLRKDVLWDSVGHLIIKYKPFLEYDRQHFKNLLKKLIKTVDNTVRV